MQRTASITLQVDIQCEACHHEYGYEITLSNTTSNSLSIVCKDPTPGLVKKIQESKFGVRRCPKCKYLQSWMVKQWKERWEMFAFVLSIPLFIFTINLIGRPWPDRSLDSFGSLVVFALVLGGYFILLMITATPFYLAAQHLLKEPNKNWHKTNGPEVPAAKFPNVQPR